MANDWKSLERQFKRDHKTYSTSLKDWCDAKGINYQTARRYIKVKKNTQSDSAQSKNAQKQSKQKRKIKSENNQQTNDTNASQPPAKNNNRKSARNSGERNAQNEGEQKNENAQNAQNGDDQNAQESAQIARFEGRKNNGQFDKGNRASVGARGNPNPENQFQEGNQFGRTSGIYSRFFPEEKQTLFEFSEIATLEDELALTRARLQSGIEFLNRITDDIIDASAMEEKIKLYEQYQKTEMRMDVLTGRIESITKTLSNLRIDDVSEHKIVADTKRIKNASRKLGLEADNLQKEGKGDDTPISDIVSDIQSMGKSGLMSE